ncbi:MAG TPA: DmsC/YnfH family molybdoenzyme membrane anchor subunit [Anaerolineales bacterium]|jgi:DMSO reductase iron-sulfur subunit
MTYAFQLDASACSGCKACQVACKDKNNLPEGVLWRRVIEISGGDWSTSGIAWENTVFAYNLSMACNHCVHPKCAGVCPTNAYHVREDGIVLLDSSKCIGCGYCNWACPYAVPQFNPASGLMSKCNFCFDAIDAGQPPACVAACPLRVLDYAEVAGGNPAGEGLALWELPGSEHPFPLPAYSRTQPHLQIQPHPAMLNGLEKTIANGEEIKPGKPKSELPLVAFTLLVQMAVGAFWASLWLFSGLWNLVQSDSAPLRLAPALVPGLPLALGALISFGHLGHKRNAWRALGNLGKSWLSREILFLGLFGAGWLLTLQFSGWLLAVITALLGLGLIFSMASVYRLRSMANWNTWRTFAGFLLSALLLGHFLLIPVYLVVARRVGIQVPLAYFVPVNLVAVLLLVGELFLATGGEDPDLPTREKRVYLIWLIALGLGLMPLVPGYLLSGYYLLLLLLLIQEESLGRWQFYTELEKRPI